jgi:hypothetical protein
MRHARLTWEGAFHHIMNRGVNEEKIFSSADLKSKYIELLAEKSVRKNQYFKRPSLLMENKNMEIYPNKIL